MNTPAHDHRWTLQEVADLQARFNAASDEEALSLWASVASGLGHRTQEDNLLSFWTPEMESRVVKAIFRVKLGLRVDEDRGEDK